jgi:CBS domain-containing protein/uncharacterized protein (DUF2267 family)
MTLERYRNHKTVIMSPTATVYEAARAMSEHQIGAVLVGQHGQISGIVTDRDLAITVIGGRADADRTPLLDVMSQRVETVDIDGTMDDVVRAMLGRGCRRVPITERGKLVGLVTLDDLVADDAALAAGAIIRRQLEIAAIFRVDQDPIDREERAQLRHERRAENTFLRMLHEVRSRTGLETTERAAVALGIVLGAVCRRLTRFDARHFLAQLPTYLRESLESEAVGPDRRVTSDLLVAHLVKRLGLEPIEAVGTLRVIGDIVAASVSAGEADSLRAHLPVELKELFPAQQRTGSPS